MFLWGRIPESYNDVERAAEKEYFRSTCISLPGFIATATTATYIRIFLCQKKKKREMLEKSADNVTSEISVVEWSPQNRELPGIGIGEAPDNYRRPHAVPKQGK